MVALASLAVIGPVVVELEVCRTDSYMAAHGILVGFRLAGTKLPS